MALDDDAFKSGRPIHGEPGALDCEAPANDQIERKILDYAQKYRGRGLGTAFIRRGVLADIHADKGRPQPPSPILLRVV